MASENRPATIGRFWARFADRSGTVVLGLPADFGILIAAESEKRDKVVKFAGIKPE